MLMSYRKKCSKRVQSSPLEAHTLVACVRGTYTAACVAAASERFRRLDFGHMSLVVAEAELN